WVVPTTVEPLREALRAALTDAGERQTRGENARRCAMENYSWDAIATRLVSKYQTLSIKP
ncbi:MAG: glycosyl transferase group 1, partial [Cyanobacteria bacterium J06588_5]